MRKIWRRAVSIIMVIAMVVLALPEYVAPVKTATAATTTRKVYVLSENLTAGKSYLIVNRNTAGTNALALSHSEYSKSTAAISEIHAATDEISAPYIEESDFNDAFAIWKAEVQGGYNRLHNKDGEENNYYLQLDGTQGVVVTANANPVIGNHRDFNWLYNGHLYITYHSSGNSTRTVYLNYNNTDGFHAVNQQGNANVYLFEEKEISTHVHDYRLESMVFDTEWFLNDLHVEATATFSCQDGDSTVTRKAQVTKSVTTADDCSETDMWTYTATVSKNDSPTGAAVSKTYTIPAQVPDEENPTQVKVYVLTDTLTAGKNYVVTNTSTPGTTGHAVANGKPNPSANDNYAAEDRAVEIITDDLPIGGVTSEKTFIKVVDDAAVWAVTAGADAGSFNFKNGDSWLAHVTGRTNPSECIVYVSNAEQQPGWIRWIVNGGRLTYRGQNNTYALTYNASNAIPWEAFPRKANDTTPLAGTPVYFFEEITIDMPGHKDAEPAGHQFPLTEVPYEAPGCETEGHEAHWKCERCETLFKDADGTQAVTLDELTIPAAHTWKFVDFTWDGSETTGYKKAIANYVCEKESTHTLAVENPTVTAEGDWFTIEEIDETDTTPAKTVFKAMIPATESPDGKSHEDEKTLTRYSVTFVDDDEQETVLGEKKYYFAGTAADEITVPQNPSKDPDEQYSYVFKEWKNGEAGISDVTENVVYKATYTTTTQVYTVSWDIDGDVTDQPDIPYGTTPVYPNAEPTKAPSDTKVYTFSGWKCSKDNVVYAKGETLPEVGGNVTFTAQFDESVRLYTVTWNVEGVETTSQYEYEATPVYPGGDDPTKPAEEDVAYHFLGWLQEGSETVLASSQLPSVYSEMYFTAVFEEATLYSIIHDQVIDGTVYTDRPNDKAEAGDWVTLTLKPREGYQLDSVSVKCGNDDIPNQTENDNEYYFQMPEGDVVVTAAFVKYFNIWVDGKQVSTLTQSDVLGDGAGNERITFSQTSEKMILTILTGDDIVLNTDADDLQNGALICVDDESGLPLEIIAEKGLSLVSDSAHTGILSTNSNITMQGDLNIELSYLGEFNLAHFGISFLSQNNSELSIVGDLFISLPIDAQCGSGIFSYGDVDIQGCGVIQGGGDHGITAWGDVSIVGKEIAIGDKFRGAISCAGVVTLECTGDKPIRLKGKEIAIGAGGSHDAEIDTLIIGNLDASVDMLGYAVIEVSGKLKIDGDVTLTGGRYGDGIKCEIVEITGNLTGAIDGYGYELVDASRSIIIHGSVHGDSKNGTLLTVDTDSASLALDNSGTISIDGDVTGIDGGKSISRHGIVAAKGITIGGDVEMQVLKEEYTDGAYAAIELLSGEIIIHGNVNLESEVDGIRAGDFDSYFGAVTMKKDAYITVTGEEHNGISADQIKMVSGIWEIKTNNGKAIYAKSGIVIPETHGVSIPEGGEIGEIDEYFTVIDVAEAEDAIAVSARIEPFVVVTFVDDDGTSVLDTVHGYPGHSPEYTGEEPTRGETEQYTFEFVGWTDGSAEYDKDMLLPVIGEDAEGSLTYTAVYKKTVKEFPVVFVDEDGETELAEETNYPYGTEPKDIVKPADPTKEPDDKYTYEFAGWSPEITEVTGEATYTATYRKILRKYTIKFVDEDGTELQSGETEYGETPAYTGKTPTKEADEQYTYEFKGWTPEIAEVTGEATYKATYEKTEIKKDEPVNPKDEKGVYELISDKLITYKLKSGVAPKASQIKRTLDDAKTFDKFKGVKDSKRVLVEGKDFKRSKGSVIIEFLPDYLDTLEVGKTVLTVSFEDGDDVTIEVEILPADAEEQKESPKTDDLMLFGWIILLIGAASFCFVLIAKRREQEEQIGL